MTCQCPNCGAQTNVAQVGQLLQPAWFIAFCLRCPKPFRYERGGSCFKLTKAEYQQWQREGGKQTREIIKLSRKAFRPRLQLRSA